MQLPDLYDAFTVPWDKWNHLDFLWAIDSDIYLFPRLLENINAVEAAYQARRETDLAK